MKKQSVKDLLKKIKNKRKRRTGGRAREIE